MRNLDYQYRRSIKVCVYGKCRAPIKPDSVHCPEHHTLTLNVQRERTKLLKTEVMTHYCGGTPYCQCPGCTTTELSALTIDHVNGDGHLHTDPANTRRIGGIELLAMLKRNNFPSGFQVLCGSCNQSKGRHKACLMVNLPHENGFSLSQDEARSVIVPPPRKSRKGLTRPVKRIRVKPVKVIISFSVDEHLVDRLKLACYQARISFSQYAEFALKSAPPVTEDLAVQLSRERRGLPTPVARPEAPVEPTTADPEAAL